MKAKSLAKLVKRLDSIAYHPKKDTCVITVKDGKKTVKVMLMPLPATKSVKPETAHKGGIVAKVRTAKFAPYGRKGYLVHDK